MSSVKGEETMMIERNDSTPRHPLSASTMLRCAASKFTDPDHRVPAHERPRREAIANTLRELADNATPVELDGWAASTYFLLANSHGPYQDQPVAAHAARAATLGEVYTAMVAVNAGTAALPQGTHVLDVPCAVALSEAFISYARSMEDGPRRRSMTATFLAEHRALVAMLPSDPERAASVIAELTEHPCQK